MLSFQVMLLGILAAVVTAQVQPVEPVVNLDYGSFRGKYNAKYNINLFRCIPFAAPPVGQNRFGAPKPPQRLQGVQDSDKSHPGCPQGIDGGAEDCLYLGLYSRPWTNTTVLRPVVVFFHGGGNVRGKSSLGVPPMGYPTLDVNPRNDFLLVYPSFRLNVFGFLPGEKVKNDKSSALNTGLLDQEFALRWVQSYISKFGGDPKQVTIWGQSSGGGSVVSQVLAQSSRTGPKLFQKAIMSSPYYPRTLKYDAPESEALYKDTVDKTGCSTAADSLQCLKSVDVRKLQKVASDLVGKYKHTISTFTWIPVIDGSFLVETLSEAVAKKRINTELAWGLYNAHEGENFIPEDFKNGTGKVYNSTERSFDSWVQGFMPRFNSTILSELKTVYPLLGESETFGYDTNDLKAGLVYRDIAISCPGLWVAKGATTKGYISEYTIAPARHASDVAFWNTVSNRQQTERGIYTSFTGGLASFIQTGNPNLNNEGITAPIPAVDSGQIWLIEDDPGLHRTPLPTLEKRCAFWQKHASLVPI